MLNRIKKKIIKEFKRTQTSVPPHIARNFLSIENFWFKYKEECKKYGHKEAISAENLKQRLKGNREAAAWIDSNKDLKNSRVLEIGCGNGTSTIALAEQGAIVTAIDVDEHLLLDAKIRCDIYGLDVTFHQINAVDVAQFLLNQKFDIIIFWACLEHMTLDERMRSIKATYEMLPVGGLWCIIGTPNRLHFFDSHTSNLPFFHWLSDELAIKYLPFVKRPEFRDGIDNIPDGQERMLQFYRWGRGISYHDIEVALQPIHELKVISCMSSYRRKNSIYNIGYRFSVNGRYALFLKRMYPKIHQGFFEPYLNLIFKK